MKKLILISVALLLLAGCKKVEQPYVHDDVEITSMIMISVGMPSQSSMSATIDQDAGTILFAVPRVNRDKYDFTKVKLTATVPFDAIISPKLSDKIWDISGDENGDPKVKITVTSAVTGKTKDYTVKAYVSSKLY